MNNLFRGNIKKTDSLIVTCRDHLGVILVEEHSVLNGVFVRSELSKDRFRLRIEYLDTFIFTSCHQEFTVLAIGNETHVAPELRDRLVDFVPSCVEEMDVGS